MSRYERQAWATGFKMLAGAFLVTLVGFWPLIVSQHNGKTAPWFWPLEIAWLIVLVVIFCAIAQNRKTGSAANATDVQRARQASVVARSGEAPRYPVPTDEAAKAYYDKCRAEFIETTRQYLGVVATDANASTFATKTASLLNDMSVKIEGFDTQGFLAELRRQATSRSDLTPVRSRALSLLEQSVKSKLY